MPRCSTAHCRRGGRAWPFFAETGAVAIRSIEQEPGMQCPYCGQPDTRVVDTRSTSDSIRRRRECQKCRKRFTTYEQISEALLIVKRDGRREPFDRHKLLQGVRIACAKRPIAMADIDRMVDQIEEHLFSLGRPRSTAR